MSEPVLHLLLFYGALVICGGGGFAYALRVYRRGRRTRTITIADVDAANARAEIARARFPAAREAWYDNETGRVVVELETGLQLSLPPNGIPGLEGASPEDLREMAVSPSGLGLHFPRIDADVFLPALLELQRQHSGNR